MLNLRFLVGIIGWFLFISVLSLHLRPPFVFAQENVKVEIDRRDSSRSIGKVVVSSDGKYIFIIQEAQPTVLVDSYILTIINLSAGKINQLEISFPFSFTYQKVMLCSTQDNQYLMIGRKDIIHVYNLQKLIKEKTIKLSYDLGSYDEFKCINNKNIFLVNRFSTITLLNLLTGKEVWSFDATGNKVWSLDTEEYILSLSNGKYLITNKRLWDIDIAEIKYTLPEGSYFVGFSPDNKHAVVIEEKHVETTAEKEETEHLEMEVEENKAKDRGYPNLLFLNISTLKVDKTFDIPEEPDKRILFSCDKRYIVYETKYHDKKFVRLDITNGKYETIKLSLNDEEQLYRKKEQLYAVYKKYLLLTSDKELRIVDITNGEAVITIIPSIKLFDTGENGWVILTKAGYYDSSPYSLEEKILRVVEGNKRYNINLYRNRFRKPEIIKRIFVDIYSQCNK